MAYRVHSSAQRPTTKCSDVFVYESALCQASLVGLIFLFAFSAYQMEQNYAGKLYGELLGAEINLTLYATFTFACFLAPVIVLTLGIKESMALGLLGYAWLTTAGLIYFNTGKSVFLLMTGAMAVGTGAALLWTAQGTFLLQHSDDSNRGFLFSVFWALFNGNGVLGGVMSFVVFNRAGDNGSSALYVAFLVCILVASILCFALQLPRQTTTAAASSINSSAGEGSGAGSGRTSPAEFRQFGGPRPSSACDEFASTLRMFGSPLMLKLALFFAYTYSFAAYQLQVFARFFDKTAFGAANVVYYATEIAMALIVGRYLDGGGGGGSSVGSDGSASVGSGGGRAGGGGGRRQRALYVLGLTTISVVGAYGMALHLESAPSIRAKPWTDEKGQPEYKLSDSRVLLPFVTFSLWGLSDCSVQTYAFWLIGAHFADPGEQTRVMAFYKFMQSGTCCLGFAVAPYMSAITQVWLLFVLYLAGVATSLLALPPADGAEGGDNAIITARSPGKDDESSPIGAGSGSLHRRYDSGRDDIRAI